MVTVSNVANVMVQKDEIVQEESLDLDLPKVVQEEFDDEDDENVISLEKLKRETLGIEESDSEAPSGKCFF